MSDFRDGPNPYARTCDALGPYAIPQGDGVKKTLRVVHCTRPRGHSPDFHTYATNAGGVVCKWTTNGQPVWPEIIK